MGRIGRSQSVAAGGGDFAAVQEDIEVKPPRAMCSKTGEECGETKCCQLTGYECYNKNAGFNGCLKECPYSGFTPKGTFGSWTCQRPQSLIPTKGASVQPSVSGPSLYCYEAFSMNPGWPKAQPHEYEIVRTQLMTHTSIFGCSEWDVFSDEVLEITPGNPGKDPALYTTKVDFPHIGLRKHMKTWINTPMFINIWKSIRQSQKYAKHQWTVKVDVDAVFFPARLSQRLVAQEVTAGGIYIVNCRYVKDGFFGPMEVISNKAFQSLLDNVESCESSLDWKKPDKLWGEDKFAERCMSAHGADAVEDLEIINDAVCDNIEDKSKMAKAQGVPYESIKLEPKVQKCYNHSVIAFHPLREPADYFECVKNSQV